jgi:hypothetical protein
MTEKFIADFTKPRVGSEFFYVGQPGLIYSAFIDKAMNAMRKTELVNGVVLGDLRIEQNKKTHAFMASAKVIRLAGNA